MRSAPTFARRGARAAAAILLLTASACATTRRAQDLPEWPPPPDKARVKFVRAFATERDLDEGFWRAVIRSIIPADASAVIKQPTGLALTPDETQLYVACSSTGTVLRADLAKGKLSVTANDNGMRAGRPFGVAVDAEGNLFVSDSAQNAVLVFSPEGKFLWKIADERIEKPTGIAIDRRGQVLYVVSGVTGKSAHHRVEVLSLRGEHLRTIGTRGAGPGEFNFPTNLAVAKDGSLLVVDMLNFRVQVFDPGGTLTGMFGTLGAGQPGTFDKAKSVALDSFGNIYVVDSQAAHVQMFNSKFQVLMAFGGRLRRPGFFLTPTAIAIDSKNTIYVAEFFGGWVAQYKLVDTTGDDSFPREAQKSSRAPAPRRDDVSSPR